jgi:putative salt-induced outer membrane protein
MKLTTILAGLAAGLLLAVAPASVAAAEDGWTGEGSLSAGYTTGNTETTDMGAGLKGARKLGDGRLNAAAGADFGENNGVESRNRWDVAGQVDRDLTDRFYLYGRASYEQDQFSGYDSRLFVGPGAGFKVITGDTTAWTLEGGPGLRRDEIARSGLVAARTEEKFGARLGSAFKHKFNDAVSFSNDTEVVYSDVSTQTFNSAAVTAKLTDKVAARFSFDVRNESDPRPGREDTDTATRFSLVFGF